MKLNRLHMFRGIQVKVLETRSKLVLEIVQYFALHSFRLPQTTSRMGMRVAEGKV